MVDIMKKCWTACMLVCFCMAAFAGGRVEYKTMPCRLLQGITEREYTVYLPPDYDTDTQRSYPVLYLLHGGGCSNTDWETYGGLCHLADSLIACGAMERMVIVCPEANKNNMIWFNADHWWYEDFFFREFVPYIESLYRIKKGKSFRSVAGYSMGGGASVVYGVLHPDMFSVVYGMSSYLRSQPLEFLKNDPSAGWRQRLVDEYNPINTIQEGSDGDVDKWRTVHWFIDCGDKDFTYDANADLISAFRRRQIPYEYRVKGGGHDWNYWRPALRDALIYVSRQLRNNLNIR